MEFVPPVMMMPGPDSIYTPVQKSGATSPFVRACENAKVIYKKFGYRQGLVASLWHGKQTSATRMRKWAQWDLVKSTVPELFKSGRRAKSFYIEMKKKHGQYAERAAERLGVSLWRPGGHGLPNVGFYARADGPDFVEVRLAVRSATGFGGDDAAELMRQEPDLMSLVAFAKSSPPPEIMEPGFC